MKEIKIVGFDPSLNNWGIAIGTLNLSTMNLKIYHLDVTSPAFETGKTTRKNSTDVERAAQLYKAAIPACEGASAVFVEVPVGSKSARAMASYGICIGVLGSIRGTGVPFFEVTPNEVKLETTGKKTATKQDMIDWAMTRHPEAPWPMRKQKGESVVIAGQAEHMADAVGAIYAGLQSADFQRMIGFVRTI